MTANSQIILADFVLLAKNNLELEKATEERSSKSGD